MNIFSIFTHKQDDFSKILDLAILTQISIPESEIPFFVEVMEILENDLINILNLIKFNQNLLLKTLLICFYNMTNFTIFITNKQ